MFFNFNKQQDYLKGVISLYKDTDSFKIITHRVSIIEISLILKLSSVYRLNNPIDVFAVDNLSNLNRFTLFYIIQSPSNNISVHLITKTSGGLPLLSVQSLFPAFNWAEREIWDMFGIFFVKHPDLRRLLTDYGFVGHPLRKDFPISGFLESSYNDKTKQIIYSPVELAQSFRTLLISSTWSNEKEV